VLGLSLIGGLKEIRLGGRYADKGIIEYSKKNKDCFVATLDKELKKSLNIMGCKVIYIRGKKKLEIG